MFVGDLIYLLLTTSHKHLTNIMLGRWLVLTILPCLAIFLFFFFFNLHMNSPLMVVSNNAITLKNPPRRQAQFSLLIGILTRPDAYDRRHFLRLIYGIQSSPIADIDIKFVFCNLTKDDQRVLIALEILRFDDIIILNCTENMNSGKTYTYFSSLPRILSHSYDYVMKADDDVFLRLVPLAASLDPLPRIDLYYGFVIPCNSLNPFVEYMSGMGFILSWDLVEWIAESSIPANDTHGPEDKLVGKWLKMGKKAKNRFSNKPAMYDYPGTNGRCSHELIADTVAVHRLKRWDQWLAALKFFNVTKGLEPSKLYNI
ncbi:beta-1,3-galactosyltransferase pvg3-like [Telopea speciosissima]|uniref:beta-1,3-galactosyltransferase pvg3-like n=1 Tax=Telopea speciosissima TaxID=54955 RepID=UPI001CC55AA7|nr:beta-1,3-galactosyltransferase pvg3-like [Telopea speciosissima]